MERIWAPWRIEYILQDDHHRGCIFCDLPDEDEDRRDLILYKDDACLVMCNRYPYNNGHLLVVPRSHVPSIALVPPAILAPTMAMVQQTVRILQETFGPDGFNIGINQGKVAGAGIVDHVHVHVVPRWNGDTNFMPVLGDVRVIPEGLESMYDRLVPLFDAIDSP